LLDDVAAGHDQDAVGFSGCGQPVGDGEHCGAGRQYMLVQSSSERGVAGAVDDGGGFVEEKCGRNAPRPGRPATVSAAWLSPGVGPAGPNSLSRGARSWSSW
jgi:hypothetical protein